MEFAHCGPGLRSEIHARARQTMAEVVALWEARGYRCWHERRSRSATWLCRFDKRLGSVPALIEEVFFAAEQEHTIFFGDWGLPPPPAELIAAFTDALIPRTAPNALACATAWQEGTFMTVSAQRPLRAPRPAPDCARSGAFDSLCAAQALPFLRRAELSLV